MKPLFITTPIYYVNDSPHLGHAYTTIASDVAARFNRLLGRDVKFLTGTDEHGQKIAKAAKEKGKNPQELVDEVSLRFKTLANVECIGEKSENLLNISNNDYIRTTETRHKKAAQELWKILQANGHIYLDKYAGWYAMRDEAFYQESELVNGKAPTGAEVEWIEEESYFFDLAKWQDKLLDFYEKNPNFIQPKARYNEVVSFVKSGLKDLSISRTNFDWGIKVPNDEKHVMYVWLDALTNYLTSAGFPDVASDEYQKFWQNADVIHIVGKDILRFHAVYWPAFLMASNLPLPKQIIAHGWWTVEGEKMSKSLGNVIAPLELIEKYGLEQTRYFLLKAMPFGNDGDLSRERMVETINADLANNIGNLSQRVLSMIYKNFDGLIPECKNFEDFGFNEIFENIKKEMQDFQFQNILNLIVSYASKANLYIDEKAPWTLKKENKITEMGEVLYVLAEAVRKIAILLLPFCPNACNEILNQLNISNLDRDFNSLNKPLKQKSKINDPKGVFPRLI